MSVERSDSRYIRSLARGLEMLKIVSQHGPITLSEAAEISGLPYPTVARMLTTLHMEKYIDRQDTTKRYNVTALVRSLAHGFQDENRLVEVARPHLVELTQEVHWPALVATPLADQMVMRDSTHTLTSRTLHHYYPGFTVPMIDSAVGQAWLAFCSSEARQQRLETIEAEADEELTHMIEIAKKDIKFGEIRQAGYAVRERNTFSAPAGKNSVIAAPIFRDDVPIGALALVYFASTHSLREAIDLYADTVMETARKIGNELTAVTDQGLPKSQGQP